MVRCLALLVVLAAAGVSAPATAGPAAPPDSAARSAARLEIPLEDGRLEVRRLLEALCDAAGVRPPAELAAVHWTIEPDTALGRAQLAVLEHLLPGGVEFCVEPGRVVVRADLDAVAAEARRLEALIGRWSRAEPDAQRRPRYGLTVATAADARAPLDEALPPGTRRAVVLVHGLDDPGWMWRDVAPALREAGHVVLRFEYPNDQPIADSADLLAAELEALRAADVRRVDVVAHSMGGLVARDVLTREAHYGGDGTGGRRFPAVDRLIMLGTPNHGSELARLRGVLEVAERISRWFSRERWRGGEDDGAGEAGRDLRPGSAFLRDLNGRPRPGHTAYTIVAGRVSPLGPDDVEDFAAWIGRVRGFARSVVGAPPETGGETEVPLVEEIVDGLGDGLVSVKSARLEGVDDFVVIDAGHISMIIDVTGGKSAPPAVPVVLERLEREAGAAAPSPPGR